MHGDADAWIARYAERYHGWYRLDQAQRRLETWVVSLDDELDGAAYSAHRPPSLWKYTIS